MSIHNIFEKIKQRTGIDHFMLVYILVIVGVGICAFGLGRLSVSGNQGKDMNVTISGAGGIKDLAPESQDSNSLGASVINGSVDTKGNYVASKNGKLYYSAGCKGANRIKEENKVWFDTAKMAESLGYIASAACK